MGQTQGPPDQTDPKQPSIARRAGQNCIALFVLFVITLLAFGKAPLTRTAIDGGSGADFNLISCLGLIGGVYALVFLILRFRMVLSLAATKKVLGLVGGFGLIVHSLLALVVLLSWGAGASVGTGGFSPMAQSGAEQWRIDGKTYPIRSTYYLRLREGLQYTIEYPCRLPVPLEQMNNQRALKIALPLMKHAYQQGLYKRATIGKLGRGRVAPSRIGVVLLESPGGRAGGYRIALPVGEIRRRITSASAPTTRS